MNFIALFIITIIIRGLAAGIIFGTCILTHPVRKEIGIIQYAIFTRVHYKGYGVKIYAVLTFVGTFLTITLLTWAFKINVSVLPVYFTSASLIATAFGFAGTAGAFPAMKKLWMTTNENQSLITQLVNRFEFWGWFSAISHVIAFCLLSSALLFLN